ncbi:MAG: TolC family protein [Chthonomonadales bacterium]
MRASKCAVAITTISILSVVTSGIALAGQGGSKDKKTAEVVQQDPTAELNGVLNLEKSILLGLKYQNTLGIASSQLDSSKARLVQSRSSYYPQVTPTYNYNTSKTTQKFNGVTQTGTVESGVTQIGASMLIFDSFKREENVLVSKYGVKGSEANVFDIRQNVIVNITVAYYELLRKKELVRVAQSSVERADTTLKATRAFAEAGTSPRKDVLQAEADYDNAVVQLSISKNDVKIGMTNLKNAIGILSTLPVVVDDAPLPIPDATPDGKTTSDYLKQAYANRYDLKREQAFIDADRHSVKVAQIGAGVQVQASVTEGYRIDPNPGENRVFATGVSYPLFDAGSARASVRQAKATLDQDRRSLQLSKQNILSDVEANFLTREEARLRIGSTTSAVKAARENYKAATEAQKEGAGTIIDVITAQNLLVTSETNAVQAVYDYYNSDARLRRAIGTNDPYPGGKKP